MENLNRAIDQKCLEQASRKEMIFHQESAGPHVSLALRKKLLKLGWDVLPNPLYSPVLGHLYCHLFHSTQNSLKVKKLSSLENCKEPLEQFFSDKPEMSHESGRMKLHKRRRLPNNHHSIKCCLYY
ncbi:hypothetical protein AVEN_115395-1 [Araneus ventricosus]|uniref:Mariner Mos1 transposase n=1 Tax=Araneus ventricosus TaxID=182803 RepID=A0A4Y1ZYB2_ARAVE|nr:hypothetical protein AVEN_115395-1 [Araneus ventricosus]